MPINSRWLTGYTGPEKRCEHCPLINSHYSNQHHLVCTECKGKYHTAETCRKNMCRRCKQKGHREDDCAVDICESCGDAGHKTDHCFKNKKSCSHCYAIRGHQYHKTKTTPTLKKWFMFTHEKEACPNICHWCKDMVDDKRLMYTHSTDKCRIKPTEFVHEVYQHRRKNMTGDA